MQHELQTNLSTSSISFDPKETKHRFIAIYTEESAGSVLTPNPPWQDSSRRRSFPLYCKSEQRWARRPSHRTLAEVSISRLVETAAQLRTVICLHAGGMIPHSPRCSFSTAPYTVSLNSQPSSHATGPSSAGLDPESSNGALCGLTRFIHAKQDFHPQLQLSMLYRLSVRL